MPRARVNGLELEYDSFGSPEDPPLVLVMGLGAQMVTWEIGFCELLTEGGFHVVRFDNRDIGLSSYLDDLPAPDLAALASGDLATAPYLLSDLASDVTGLFDALGFERAHVVGASMGGMIVQQLAIDAPERLLSLTSIMSTTGDPSVGYPEPAALAGLTRPPAVTREQAIEDGVTWFKLVGSPGHPSDDEFLRMKATRNHDRANHPAGALRQAAAVVASGDRTARLREVRVPTLVIHGESDPLINVSGGKATATAIPDAELVLFPGMGHELPRQLWPAIAETITAHARKV